MTAKEAAAIIGCTPSALCYAIRAGRIKPAARLPLPGGRFYYDLTSAEVNRFAKLPAGKGRPRGHTGKAKKSKYVTNPTGRQEKTLAPSYIRKRVHYDDDAEFVARHNTRSLNIAQVRILRALRSAIDKPIDRATLAQSAGGGANYGSGWLKALWELAERNFITITANEDGEGHSRKWHLHRITALGRHVLGTCERQADRRRSAGVE